MNNGKCDLTHSGGGDRSKRPLQLRTRMFIRRQPLEHVGGLYQDARNPRCRAKSFGIARVSIGWIDRSFRYPRIR